MLLLHLLLLRRGKTHLQKASFWRARAGERGTFKLDRNNKSKPKPWYSHCFLHMPKTNLNIEFVKVRSCPCSLLSRRQNECWKKRLRRRNLGVFCSYQKQYNASYDVFSLGAPESSHNIDAFDVFATTKKASVAKRRYLRYFRNLTCPKWPI